MVGLMIGLFSVGAMISASVGWAFSTCSVYQWAVRIRLRSLATVTANQLSQWKALRARCHQPHM